MMRYTAVALLTLCTPPLVFADASYQETTEITGGSLVEVMKMASVFSSRAKQAQLPTAASVMIRGNRMVRSGPLSTEIIDLDQQTITNVDVQKRQYYVTTFAQMQEAVQRAAQQNKQKKTEGNNGNDSANVSFNAKVRDTGVTKQVDGRDAKEFVMTLTMDATSTTDASQKGSLAITSDMWLIPDAPGYEEVKSFNMRLGKALATDTEMSSMAAILNSQPGAGQAMADMKKEMVKMAAIPILQVMRMGMTVNGEPLPAPSQDAAQTTSADGNKPAENTAAQSKAAENNSVASTLGGMLGGGGFGSLMRHKAKKNSQNSDTSSNTSAESARAQNGEAGQPGVLLETSIRRSNFSADSVDAANFDVPAGYKLVESPMSKTR